MALAETDLPPYDPDELLATPFADRIRHVCRNWAFQINPNPFSIIVMYWAKYLLLFVGGWAFFCSFSAGYPGFTDPVRWAFTADGFQRMIAWALFYESVGFGCSSGPMNARFIPPIGGFLHFARPGTTKLPLFPGIPVLGGIRRTWLDVALYVALQLSLVRALVAPEITTGLLLPAFFLIPVLGVTDKTIFLAARSEHYWVALVCLTEASQGTLWIAACKVVWIFIWFWAATSKINHHFPSVIQVMMNNGPFFPAFLKKRLFVSYPDDLRPSRFATLMAHMGTVAEYSIPVLLLAFHGHPTMLVLCLAFMCSFHGFIALNNPNGMPIEWNIAMIYGGIFLFGFHPDVMPWQVLEMPLLTAFLAFCLIAVPTYGNFVPSKVSFLLSMRYYAGNWAYNIWLVKKGAEHRFQALKKASGTFREQMTRMLGDEKTVDAAVALMPASRFMHLEGRPLLEALPLAVDDLDDYEWMEGEVVAGMVLGWNFGDGHLNHEQLLEAVQAQCGFEPGELRMVAVESQPLFGPTMQWRVVDAATGELERGETAISPMRALQPYPEGEHLEALRRGRRGLREAAGGSA